MSNQGAGYGNYGQNQQNYGGGQYNNPYGTQGQNTSGGYRKAQTQAYGSGGQPQDYGSKFTSNPNRPADSQAYGSNDLGQSKSGKQRSGIQTNMTSQYQDKSASLFDQQRSSFKQKNAPDYQQNQNAGRFSNQKQTKQNDDLMADSDAYGSDSIEDVRDYDEESSAAEQPKYLQSSQKKDQTPPPHKYDRAGTVIPQDTPKQRSGDFDRFGNKMHADTKQSTQKYDSQGKKVPGSLEHSRTTIPDKYGKKILDDPAQYSQTFDRHGNRIQEDSLRSSGTRDRQGNEITGEDRRASGKPSLKSKEKQGAKELKQNYQLDHKTRTLGSGAFGKIFLTYSKRDTRQQVALKVLNRSRLDDRLADIQEEIQILTTLDHPNLVKYYEVYNEGKCTYLVMEYIDGGLLLDEIAGGTNQNWDERTAAMYIKKLLQAVDHLHRHGIVHKDIKPTNIMLTRRGDLKLVDVGLSKRSRNKDFNDNVSSLCYMAPEALDGAYVAKSDIWSLGVLLYVFMSGYFPFQTRYIEEENRNEIINKIRRGKINVKRTEFDQCSRDVVDLMKRLLAVDPKQRYSADEALRHPWFQTDSRAQRQSNPKMTSQVLQRIQEVKDVSKLKKAAMNRLVKMTDQQAIEDLKSRFEGLDQNRTGLIDAYTLNQTIGSCGLQMSRTDRADIDRIIAEIDYVGNEQIDYTEFLAAVVDVRSLSDDEEIRGLIDRFGTAGSGTIPRNNIVAAMNRTGSGIKQEELATIMGDRAADGKSQVSLMEFRALLLDFNDLQESYQRDQQPKKDKRGGSATGSEDERLIQTVKEFKSEADNYLDMRQRDKALRTYETALRELEKIVKENDESKRMKQELQQIISQLSNKEEPKGPIEDADGQRDPSGRWKEHERTVIEVDPREKRSLDPDEDPRRRRSEKAKKIREDLNEEETELDRIAALPLISKDKKGGSKTINIQMPYMIAKMCAIDEQLELVASNKYSQVFKAISTSNRKSVAIKVIDRKQMVQHLQERDQAEMRRRLDSLKGDEAKRLNAGEIAKVEQVLAKKLNMDLLDILEEANTLPELDHPAVAKYLKTYMDEQYIYHVMEYIEGEVLYDKLSTFLEPFTEQMAAKEMRKLFSAVSYLSSKGIVHGDINPSNVLLTKAGELKIVDFGLSKKYHQTESFEPPQDSYLFMAPEIIDGSYQEGGGEDHPRDGGRERFSKSDSWSLGVMLHLLLTGKLPFGKDVNSREQLARKVCDAPFKVDRKQLKKFTPEAGDLIEALLVVDPRKRLSAAEAAGHPWLKMLQQGKLKNRTFEQAQIGSQFDRGLRDSRGGRKLKIAAINMLANADLQNSIDDLRQALKQVDTHNSGQIYGDELARAISQSRIGISEDAAKRTIDAIHAEYGAGVGGVYLEYADLLDVSLEVKKFLDDIRLCSLFYKFDQKGLGKISKEDISAAINRMNQEYPERAVQLDREELAKRLEQLIEQHKIKNWISFSEFKSLLFDIQGYKETDQHQQEEKKSAPEDSIKPVKAPEPNEVAQKQKEEIKEKSNAQSLQGEAEEDEAERSGLQQQIEQLELRLKQPSKASKQKEELLAEPEDLPQSADAQRPDLLGDAPPELKAPPVKQLEEPKEVEDVSKKLEEPGEKGVGAVVSPPASLVEGLGKEPDKASATNLLKLPAQPVSGADVNQAPFPDGAKEPEVPVQPGELKPESISPSKAPPAPSDVGKKVPIAVGADSTSKKEDDRRREQKQPEEAFFVGTVEVGNANKYSIPPTEQAKRLIDWVSNMRLFKLFNNDRLPPPKYPEPRLYTIKLSQLAPQLNLPAEYAAQKFEAYIQFNCTLCDPAVGLFGRTAMLKSGSPKPIADLSVDSSLMFHSDLDLSKSYLICEVIVQITDKSAEGKLVEQIGLGLLALKIEDGQGGPSGNRIEYLYLATPRSFMYLDQNQLIDAKLKMFKFTEKKMGGGSKDKEYYKMNVQIGIAKGNPLEMQQLMIFLPPNCLACSDDRIPGLKDNKLPQDLTENVLKELQFGMSTNVWVHDIRLENIDKVDRLFNKYLQHSVGSSGYSASIVSRRITVTSSNSCSLAQLSQSVIDLKAKESKGRFKVENPKQIVKLQNLASNRMTCLVFRIAYKVKYEQAGAPPIVRELVLGRNPFFLNFSETASGFIRDREVEFDLGMCPALQIINDQLWDVNQSNTQSEDLYITISMTLSNSEDLKSEQGQQELEHKYVKDQIQKMKQAELEKGNSDVKVDEGMIKKMAEMEIRNLSLQKELQFVKAKAQQDIKRAEQVAAQKAAEERKEEMKAKDQLAGAQEQEQPIAKEEPAQVPAEQIAERFIQPLPAEAVVNPQYSAAMIDGLLKDQDTDARKLIGTLQKLLEQTDSNQAHQSEVIMRLQRAIDRMLEKETDPTVTLYGTTGKSKASQSRNLTEKEKSDILESNASEGGPHQQDSQLLDIQRNSDKPRLDIELKDQFKASTITFKFVAFKTLDHLKPTIRMPERLFFTTKFYTFKQTKTEQVLLRLPKSVARDHKRQQAMQRAHAESAAIKPDGQLLAAQQYFLMRFVGFDAAEPTKDTGADAALDEEYEGFANGLEISFDFDPSGFVQNCQQMGPDNAMTGSTLLEHAKNLPKDKKEDLDEREIAAVPQRGQATHQHELFSKYLYERVITIDLWDSGSLMHFGSCKIPLFLLMRQGEPAKYVGQEFDVLEPECAERVGGLQLVITNQGRAAKLTDYRAGPAARSRYGTEKSYGPGAKNKKKVTSKPIEDFEIQETLEDKMNKERAQANLNLPLDPKGDERKKMRVQRLKRREMGHRFVDTALNNPDAADWEKAEQLKAIQLIREQNKAQILEKLSRVTKMLSAYRTLEVTSGHPHLLEIQANNPFDDRRTFQIVIRDEDYDTGSIPVPELELVDNSNHEWQHWHKLGRCSEPYWKPNKEEEKVSKNDFGYSTTSGILPADHTSDQMAAGRVREVVLDGGETCTLLFKFQSFREPIVDESGEDKWKNAYSRDPANELRPRQILLEMGVDKNEPTFQMQISIQPKEMICDQVFRYYEAQNTRSHSIVPNFVRHQGVGDVIPFNECKVVCNNKNFDVRVGGEDHLTAFITNGASMTVEKGFIFIYQGPLMSQLLGACKIEVHSMKLVQMAVEEGAEVGQFLKVTNPPREDASLKQRTAELFSTNPQLIYGAEGGARNLVLLKAIGSAQSIPQLIRGSTAGVTRARLNCVDIDASLMLEQFLLEVTTTITAGREGAKGPGKVVAAVPRKVQKVTCILGRAQRHQVQVTNPNSKSEMTFTFQSRGTSHKFIQPKEPTVTIRAGEKKDVVFEVPAQKQTMDAIEAQIDVSGQANEPEGAVGSSQSRLKSQGKSKRSREPTVVADQIEFSISVK